MRQRPPPVLSQGRNGEGRNCSFEAAHYYCGRASGAPASNRTAAGEVGVGVGVELGEEDGQDIKEEGGKEEEEE